MYSCHLQGRRVSLEWKRNTDIERGTAVVGVQSEPIGIWKTGRNIRPLKRPFSQSRSDGRKMAVSDAG
jgi:hypothetical protein